MRNTELKKENDFWKGSFMAAKSKSLLQGTMGGSGFPYGCGKYIRQVLPKRLTGLSQGNKLTRG